MKNILYISYGIGLHQQEAAFSLLSALRFAGSDTAGIQFIILTDHPGSFAGLPAIVEYIPPELWQEWSGPTRFNHRRKIMALKHVLHKFPGPTVLLDADTWLRKSPGRLFDRIAAGKTLMHIREARIFEIATPQGRKIVDFLARERFRDMEGHTLEISDRCDLWNAGVVGLHPSDAKLLDEVLHLTDQFCARSDLHILEQLAFSWVFAKRTRLQEAYDIVFHYWPPYLHDPFRTKLPKIMEQYAGLPLKERILRSYAQRPRPTLPRRGKVILKRCLQMLGILRGRSRSNEW